MTLGTERGNVEHLLALEDAWCGLNVTSPQVQVLFLAVAHNGPSGPYIQRRLGMLPSTLTRIADKLVGAGLVERRQASDDRRLVYYMPTDQGRELMLHLLPGPNE